MRLLKVFLFLFIFLLIFDASSVKAQTPTPKAVPPPIVKCNEVRPDLLHPYIPGLNTNTEYHSLRPYQASPCTVTPANYAEFCGNELILKESIPETYNPGDPNCITVDNKVTCTYNIQVPPHPITINLSGASLPIMGNTEDVVNYKNTTDTILDPEKVNEYVSWYLGGVTNKKEYPGKTDDNSVVNYSGPIAKLLPQEIQLEKRVENIENAIGKRLDSSQENVSNIRHDQVAVCVNPLTSKPEDCGFLSSKYKLSYWSGEIPFNSLISKLISLFEKLVPGLGGSVIGNLLATQSPWTHKYPPLSWNFDSNLKYRKAYNEWHGQACIIVPVLNVLVCVDNPFVSEKYANLFPFVPISSTEDLKGNIEVSSTSSATNPSTSRVTVNNIAFTGQKPTDLFFSHLAETSDEATALQDTFVSKGQDKIGNPTDVASSASCDTLEVRTNKGDNLFANAIEGDLSYSVSFSCNFASTTYPPVSGDVCTIRLGAQCVPSSWTCGIPYGNADCPPGYRCGLNCSPQPQTCTKDVYVRLSTSLSTPNIDNIWSQLVAGPMSIFKRIFPKTNTQGSVGKIMDIPGSTDISYTAKGLSSDAQLNLPHIGGVSEYFLKGIQTILRPKGYGEDIQFANSTFSSGCGKTFAKYSPPQGTTSKADSFFNQYIKPRLTDSLMSVYADAESQTGLPCEVIAGVHFVEGDNDPNRSLQDGNPLNGRPLIDSAIQAANEIKAKVGGTINTWDDLITALSRYNGGGNSNCGWDTPYTGPCPPPEGIDDIYPVSWIDSAHEHMYLIYCKDLIQCEKPFPEWNRPGALTVATEVFNSISK